MTAPASSRGAAAVMCLMAVSISASCASVESPPNEADTSGEVRGIFDQVVAAANGRDGDAYAALLCEAVRRIYAESADAPLSGFPPVQVIAVEPTVADSTTAAHLYATTRWSNGTSHRTRYRFTREHRHWKYCPDAVWTRGK